MDCGGVCRPRADAIALACGLAAAVGIAAAACGRPPGASPPLTVRDSAGVELIEVAEAVLDTLPEWSLDSGALAIGTLDGPPEYELHLAASPWQLSDGRLVVANGQSEVRYYDARGRHLRTVGSRGQGPGQYRQLWNLYPLDADSLLAFDVLGRVSILDPSGRFVRSYAYPLRAYGAQLVWLPDRGAVFFDDYFERMVAGARRTDAVIQDTAFLLIADAAGRARDTLDRLPSGWRWQTGNNWSDVWFSGDPLLVAGSGVLVAGHGDAFALRWYRVGRGLERITRVRAAPHPVTQRDVEWAEAELREMARRFRPEGPGQTFHRPPHAKNLPFITRLRLDRGDRTWVRRWAFDDAPRAPWVVFDSAGRPLARIEMPGAFRRWDIGEDYVLGVLRDPGAVDVVLRCRLRRAAGAGGGR